MYGRDHMTPLVIPGISATELSLFASLLAMDSSLKERFSNGLSDHIIREFEGDLRGLTWHLKRSRAQEAGVNYFSYFPETNAYSREPRIKLTEEEIEFFFAVADREPKVLDRYHEFIARTIQTFTFVTTRNVMDWIKEVNAPVADKVEATLEAAAAEPYCPWPEQQRDRTKK